MSSVDDTPVTLLEAEQTDRLNKALATLIKPRSAAAQVVLRYARHHELACSRVNPEWFFVNGPADPDRREKWAFAQGICASCPVRRACADWALEDNERGLWGGTTEGERDRERARRKSARRDVA
ncbi:WhiB family transcriptional regulator [Actinomycetospora termitidis]|uniref:WhiB family transcriptional regulator n=1 Tax=Actinomycetospora termitidis TaxID=3053470 RepID=A0ABT7MFN6_9PSEU|nr:WhiB family transcriptional regulator [Actinomycetospora sp. Odt1-22]MDL5159470.1 WhiB family transcriptional regulator [Actinomycetospora sp. Odt1-22]